MAELNVFRKQHLANLENSIEDNLDHYKTADNQFFYGDGQGILKSSYSVPDEAPSLDPNAKNEADNAIHVFEYLLKIDNTAASDPRLWAYLAHVIFCDYATERWNIKDGSDGLKDKIEQRFFVNGNARSLRRHAISRLWWATKLTVAPWESNALFEPLKKEDRYYYTRVLMEDESISSDLVERVQLSASPELLIAILEFLDNHPEFRKRELWREFMKEIILTLGYRKIMALDLPLLQAELDDIAFEIKRRLKSQS